MLTVTDFADRSTWKVLYTMTKTVPDGPVTTEEGINVIADDVIEAATAVIEHVARTDVGIEITAVQLIGSGDSLIVAGVE